MKKLLLIVFLILFGCGPAISYDMHNSWREVDEATDEVQAAQPLPDEVLIPPGGTTGQILMKQSNDNGDTYWADAPSGPPSGCDPATDEIGIREANSTMATSSGVARLWLAVPECNGAIQELFVSRSDSDQAEVRIMVYLDDGDEIPNSGDILVDTGVIDPGPNSGWFSVTAENHAILDTASKYWMVEIVSETAAMTLGIINDTVDGKVYYAAGQHTWFDSPPANLPDGGYNADPDLTRRYSMYGTLQ